MRYFLILLLPCMLIAHEGKSYSRKNKDRGGPKTEVELMNSVVSCLSRKDTAGYYYLFPPFDTLWRMVMHNSDHSPEAERQLANLKEHPQALIDFDPYYNRSIIGSFCNVLTKGEDSGIHWGSIVIQSYELQQERLSQNLEGYDRIAPERFKGYLFVRDLLGRQTFCISITEIQKIEGYFTGGQVINILQASSIDQFLAAEVKEQQYLAWLAIHPYADTAQDSAKKAGSLIIADDDDSKVRKQVVDRKYYEGMFDEEIPVKLYVRYMKDVRSGKTSFYDGLYKFGDQKDFVKLEITVTPDGKWTMEDDPPVGVLELVLKNKVYTGSWTSDESGSGYDVLLTQADLPEKKLEQLDNILDRGLSGSASEKTIPEKEKEEQDKKKEKEKNTGDESWNDGN